MTRIEAFKALFGADADRTASQEAFDTIKSSPRPSAAEEGQLDANTLDSACDFADRPQFFVDGLPAGKAKTILTAGAASLAAAAPAPAAPPAAAAFAAAAPVIAPAPAVPLVRPAPTAAAPGVIADPLAGLLGGAAGAAAPAGARAPSGRVAVPPPGSAPAPRRRDDDDSDDDEEDPPRHNKKKRGKGDRGDDDHRHDEPKHPPPMPVSSITSLTHETIVQRNPAWPTYRDAIVRAFLCRDDASLRDYNEVMEAKLAGEQGDEQKMFGQAMKGLIYDLRAGVHQTHHDEFRRRFWYP